MFGGVANPARAIAVALTALVLSTRCEAGVTGAASDNIVLRWNRIVLDAIVGTRSAPPIAARSLAIAHTCIFDAWAAYDARAIGTRLGARLRRPVSEHSVANKEKAISFAAYRAVSDLFPSQIVSLLEPVMEALGYGVSASNDITKPDGIGDAACRAVLDARHVDGANQLGDQHTGAYSDFTGYSPTNREGLIVNPNRWQPLRVNGAMQSWLLPHWGRVSPFALTAGSQFRSYALARWSSQYPSAALRQQTYDLIELSARLGDTEKAIAEYWADGGATVTPPGHWNVFAQIVSRRDKHSLDQDAQLFFILNNALLDASIAVWDVKRYADSIRPVTVIRALMENRKIMAWAGPGLGTREIDCKDFRSYIPTPPFGSYVSGHSAFSAAAAEVLKRFTGDDAFGESVTVLPGSSIIERGLTPANPVNLNWPTFSAAADQAGMSRRYGGIHFEVDDLVGRDLGRLVADVVWKRAMIYIDGDVL